MEYLTIISIGSRFAQKSKLTTEPSLQNAKLSEKILERYLIYSAAL